jgi:signal transduction histidine kinase
VKLRAAADASIETLRPFDVECRLKSVHGEERRVQVRGRPRRLPDGSTLWDAIALDVSDRKRAETAEREAAMLRAVAALAAAAAHEINNPLAVIMGRISLAREDGQLGEHAGAVLEAVQRMHEIVTRLGQITKLELLGDVPSDLPPMLDIRRSGERRGP